MSLSTMSKQRMGKGGTTRSGNWDFPVSAYLIIRKDCYQKTGTEIWEILFGRWTALVGEVADRDGKRFRRPDAIAAGVFKKYDADHSAEFGQYAYFAMGYKQKASQVHAIAALKKLEEADLLGALGLAAGFYEDNPYFENTFA
eukprot:737169_1